jgi:4-amino-4-deoxy-L-arabinose transferase-like glycosyltransferase
MIAHLLRLVPSRGLPAIAPALAVAAMVLGLMQYAAGGLVAYTMDSLTYRDVVVNFAAGHPMQSSNVATPVPESVPLLNWPPAYPALWALAMSVGHADIDDVPSLLNPVLLILTTLTIFWVGMMVTGRVSIAAVIALVNAFTPGNMVVYGHAWSETLFIPLLLMAYAAFWKYRISGQEFIWLAAAAVCVGIANWVRYAGVAFLPILGVSVLLASGAASWRRVLHAAGSMLLGVVLVLPLWLRNWQLAGNISGSTRGGVSRMERGLEDVAAIIDLVEHSFFAFSMVLRANLEIPILVAVAILGMKAFRRRGFQWLRPPEVWLPIVWAMGYLLFLLYARKAQADVDLDLRMLAVAGPFLLFALIPATDTAFADRFWDLKKIVIVMLLGLLINTGLQQAHRTHENYASDGVPRWRATFGLGYRDVRNTSTVSRALRDDLANIDPSTLILTDYRAVHLRYLTGGKVYSPPGNDCSDWKGAPAGGVLFIGSAELPAWAIDCLKAPSQWRLQRPTGRAAPSMQAD